MNTLLKSVVFIFLGCMLFSCKREVITKEPTLEDIQNKLLGTWKGKYLEQETYAGNVMTNKTIITSSRNSIDFKSNLSYTSVFETQAPESGSWELVGKSYLHFDKGRTTDRFYHIITLDELNLVYRGPFDANGNAKFAYLITVYNFK